MGLLTVSSDAKRAIDCGARATPKPAVILSGTDGATKRLLQGLDLPLDGLDGVPLGGQASG